MNQPNQQSSGQPWPKKSSIKERKAIERFRDEVCEQSKAIDPSEEQDWFSLSLGFFLALKIPPDRAGEDYRRELRLKAAMKEGEL